MIFIDGFGGQRVYIVPSHQLVIVRTGEVRADWDDARLPNAILRGVRALFKNGAGGAASGDGG